ncbi:MAG TPA: TetR-like C-terminal domain-containing protein [Solirubrobacterales bacterium]|nr:TetR-like C-terminal domain-containing protein [Solirubrobacterales bacterium]
MSRREEITVAARALLEEEGEEALTMRSLAERLGIKAPSLYKHVSGRQEIETLLAAEALTEMGETLANESGLEAMGRAYRTWALDNPALYRVATTRPLDRENLTPGLEDAAAAPLLEALDGDRNRARAFWALAHGLVLLELDGRFPEDADLEAAWAAGLG